MRSQSDFGPRGWSGKFRVALRGIHIGPRGQNSFLVHFAAACAVILLAWYFKVSPTEWCLLTLSIAMVIAAEYLNTGLEHLAKAIDRKRNPHLADALDTASAGVLVASGGAVVVGAIVFGGHLWQLWQTG